MSLSRGRGGARDKRGTYNRFTAISRRKDSVTSGEFLIDEGLGSCRDDCGQPRREEKGLLLARGREGTDSLEAEAA